ncbi:MAG: hypothetical protein AM325_016365, partial [Candidatus Thorarchaeota archaeon SMTZ1-45]
VVGWLSERSGFIKKHRRKFEFALEMGWWVLLWVVMISHSLLLGAECPLIYNPDLQVHWCEQVMSNATHQIGMINVSLP